MRQSKICSCFVNLLYVHDCRKHRCPLMQIADKQHNNTALCLTKYTLHSMLCFLLIHLVACQARQGAKLQKQCGSTCSAGEARLSRQHALHCHPTSPLSNSTADRHLRYAAVGRHHQYSAHQMPRVLNRPHSQIDTMHKHDYQGH